MILEVFCSMRSDRGSLLGNTPFVIDTAVHSSLYNTFRTQQLLGWEALLNGFLASELVEY